VSRKPKPDEPGRLAVHELDPELRDRLLALDEPVSQPDWADVLARSTTTRSRGGGRILRAMLAATTIGVAAAVAAPAMGVRVGKLIDFWATPAAPRSAQSTFGQDPLWTRGLPKGLEIAKTRRIAVDAFRGESMRLFVAPLAQGGFCYEWALKPGAANVWIDEQGGCSVQSNPLTLGYDDTRVSIVANPKLVDGVSVTLSDGRVVHPKLRWVSAPVSSGFLLYQPPSGSYVAEVDALHSGAVVERYPIGQERMSLQHR
jgi:hypothetical protein